MDHHNRRHRNNQPNTPNNIVPSPHQQILFDDSDISIGVHNNPILNFSNDTLNFYQQELDIEVREQIQLDFENHDTSFRMHSDDSENDDEETSNISLSSEIRTTASSNNTSNMKEDGDASESESTDEVSYYICANLNKQMFENHWKEIGEQANWTLSSAKQGNGIIQLRDNKLSTFWQSDGIQPHFIGIQFFKAVRLAEICMFLNFKEDESYTPQVFSIRVGSSLHDLVETHSFEVKEAQGWVCAPFGNENSSLSYKLVRFAQIAVLGNHQNGRDTHIRQIKVFTIGNESDKIRQESVTQFGFQSKNLDLLSHLK